MPSLKHTLFAILCIFVLNLSAYARPMSVRQVNGSQTLETVTTEMTPDGPVTATCTIVLTPVTDGNGQAAVQEVKTCKLALNPSPSQPTASTAPVESSSQISPGTSSSTTSTDDSTASNVAPTTTASASPSGGSGAVSAHPVSSVTVSSSSASESTSASPSKGAVSAQPVSTVTPITSTSISSPTSTSSSPSTTTSSTGAQSTSDASSATTAASSTASGTTAADSSSAAIDLPGKKLSVLPIGLGVFAGISVIALIVVGLVTYERRKYRKAFRQRKLAESGAAMGYGGMAQ